MHVKRDGHGGQDASSWICHVTFPDLEFSKHLIVSFYNGFKRPGERVELINAARNSCVQGKKKKIV